MKRTHVTLGSLLGLSLLILVAKPATSQIQVLPSFVKLQEATPGIAQTGHSNISGTAIAGQFQGDGGLLTGLDAGAVGFGLLSPAFGGTGLDTSGSAVGSMLVADGGGGWGLLSPGNDTQVLTLSGGVPVWGDAAGFSLPYAGSADVPSPNAVFKLTNTNSTNGSTLWCETSGTNGIGVYSVNSATTGFAYGGLFRASSPDGRAVFGENTSPTGAALAGRFGTVSTAGTAVYATASAATGFTRGIYADVYSENGIALYGICNTTFGGTGVMGVAALYGVYGKSTAPVGGNGVYGEQSGFNGYGVYALGRFGASGTKAFRIDDPRDPENKYLLHYCSEGPEPLNIYSGTARTDRTGNSVVTLPDYFDAINRDARVQLTVSDETADFVMVKVVGHVKDGRFQIRTSKGGVEVFWRVEAVRNDRWVQKYGVPIEIEKVGREKGKYQHPELYGKPASMGIGMAGQAARVSGP